MEFYLTNDVREVRDGVDLGWCPVECSIDGQSIVDDLIMDHHGELSGLESVAIRAYRDHHGARVDDPRFVGVGVADADMTFAIASLAGIIPANDPEIMKLAQLIAKLDTDPIGVDITQQGEAGEILLVWRALFGGARDSDAGMAAITAWTVLVKPSPFSDPLFKGAADSEARRREYAALDMRRGEKFGAVLALSNTQVWGFDIWYGRDAARDQNDPEAWGSPVVMALAERHGSITIGCPNATVAEKLLGPGGLKNVFAHPAFEGWGGREAIGGSPRGERMNEAALYRAAEIVASLIK